MDDADDSTLPRRVMGVLSYLELCEPLPVRLSKLDEAAADEAYKLGLVRLLHDVDDPRLQLTRKGFAAIDAKRDRKR